MHKGRSGKLLQIYVAWGYFNGQVLLLAEPSSIFIRGKKNKNFTIAPIGTFCFVTLNLRNHPMEIWEIIVTWGSH